MTIAKPSRRGVPQPLHGGPQRFGPYMLEARLAVGTTTEVYLARLVDLDADPHRGQSLPDRFVVKRLLPHLVAETEGRVRFEREAALHAAVSHPNVVTVFASGVTEHGEPFLAMEYVEGCDVFRLLRRTTHERGVLPATTSVYIAREVLAGLAAVHGAREPSEPHGSFAIIHRDVTPSNIYLSRAGDVKLGDFGIARTSQSGVDVGPSGDGVAHDLSLMGKFSYLAPEQVAGEPFDHRADLFSMATVLTELLIGKPLFPGTGQLQVLLAIRDCNLTPLLEAQDRLPAGLVPVLQTALARDPSARFPDAVAFAAALAPFASSAVASQREVAIRVTNVQTVPSDAHLAAVRETARSMRAVTWAESGEPAPSADAGVQGVARGGMSVGGLEPEAEFEEQDTGLYPELQSFATLSSGERVGPLTFTKLVEAIAAGVVQRGDLVDYIGMGPRPVEEIPDLMRLLPKGTMPPASATAPSPIGDAGYEADLAVTSMLDVLAHILVARETGLLLLDRPGHASAPREASSLPGEPAPPGHGDLYFLRGRLHHVGSTKASERLGELLVRRGKLAREELDLALAVLPRYGGRMGDTLIGLGLVDGVDIFRAIREQGRDRVTELFHWCEGTARFYPDTKVPAVEFPLDLDLATVMLAGVEVSHPGDTPMAFIEPHLDSVLGPNARPELASFAWPPLVAAVQGALTGR